MDKQVQHDSDHIDHLYVVEGVNYLQHHQKEPEIDFISFNTWREPQIETDQDYMRSLK